MAGQERPNRLIRPENRYAMHTQGRADKLRPVDQMPAQTRPARASQPVRGPWTGGRNQITADGLAGAQSAAAWRPVEGFRHPPRETATPVTSGSSWSRRPPLPFTYAGAGARSPRGRADEARERSPVADSARPPSICRSAGKRPVRGGGLLPLRPGAFLLSLLSSACSALAAQLSPLSSGRRRGW